MFQKTLTLILAFATLFFLGYGITGFYAIDPSEHSLCIEDSDCSYSVCCPLTGKDYGICGQESECASLLSQGSSMEQAPSIGEVAERSYIAVALGLVLLMFLAIVGYLEWKTEKEGKKRKKSRK
ncbi:hypothetical protein EXS74_03035 [Candidatus Woesearchaeota archaeon]|nr:hypothetical protein [Candidatus Woesearchaeota archaeon]